MAPTPPRKISHSWSVGTLVGGTKTNEGPTRSPASFQGHARVSFGDVLLRVWAELRGDCIHLYPNPNASLPLQVTPSLNQCSVSLTKSKKGCIVTSITGTEELILYLQNEVEAEEWLHALRDFSKRVLSLEGLNLECGSTVDNPCKGIPSSSIKIKKTKETLNTKQEIHTPDPLKEELLTQMIATKTLLERKRLHRSIKDKGAWERTAREMTNEYERAQHEAQQAALRKVVLLRQRKNSTAIKVANLEKCSSQELLDQVSALKDKLKSLDIEMEQEEKESEKTLLHLSQQHNQHLELIKDFGGVEDIDEESPYIHAPYSPKTADAISKLGGFNASFTSLPSLVNAHKKEKLFNFLGGNRRSRSRSRKGLGIFEKKIKFGQRHNSYDTLFLRSKSSLDGQNHRSTSFDSSEDEDKVHELQKTKTHHKSESGLLSCTELPSSECLVENEPENPIRTEISQAALDEIESFKELIRNYFKRHPDEKIPHYYRVI